MYSEALPQAARNPIRESFNTVIQRVSMFYDHHFRFLSEKWTHFQ